MGFSVAQYTGLRWLGAGVLIIGGLWCALRLWRSSGAAATVIVGVAYAVAFVVSHPLGKAIGAWPAVLLTAAVVAVLAYALMRPTTRRVSSTTPPTRSTR